MSSVYRRSALIGQRRIRPAHFSAPLARDWTAGSLLMSLHVGKTSDGAARPHGKRSLLYFTAREKRFNQLRFP